MAYRNSEAMIEGIGNDVVLALVAVTVIVLVLIGLIVFWQQSLRNISIHPHSATAVADTRSRLQNIQQPTSSSASTRRHVRTDRTCPICLADARFGIETNCGHLFCGECMVTYWRHGNWLGSVRCPVCRQQVTLLLQNFTDADRHNSAENRNNVVEQINRYNRRFSGEPIAWLDYIRDLPTLLRHAFREVFTLGGLIWIFRLRIFVCFIAALLYFISPLDLIPEAAFGMLGLLDDFFILFMLGIYITIIYRRALAARAAGTR
ncbi:hypothetical protein LSH36_16g06033 [Paralvinella palmiformis]|uniref:E3 ubiquitin-protein ligase RNF170 n=1 Tax=Paralvinella palmiformis TaxID=53620 RepID=A0AAD9NIL7_9ANNE|nr:hypothetical protein LSH36_16g06033 [Paralvinella palmiformis]